MMSGIKVDMNAVRGCKYSLNQAANREMIYAKLLDKKLCQECTNCPLFASTRARTWICQSDCRIDRVLINSR